MNTQEKCVNKRCEFCGQFFKPDRRVGSRQRSCRKSSCKLKRKRSSQREWVKNNPDYFKGRYSEIRVWRGTHSDYQGQWRKTKSEIQDKIERLTPSRTIRLVVPASFFKVEIQDEIRFVRHCGCGSWIARWDHTRYKTRSTPRKIRCTLASWWNEEREVIRCLITSSCMAVTWSG